MECSTPSIPFGMQGMVVHQKQRTISSVKWDQLFNTLIRSSFEWATNESFSSRAVANRFSFNKLESECNYVSKNIEFSTWEETNEFWKCVQFVQKVELLNEWNTIFSITYHRNYRFIPWFINKYSLLNQRSSKTVTVDKFIYSSVYSVLSLLLLRLYSHFVSSLCIQKSKWESVERIFRYKYMHA